MSKRVLSICLAVLIMAMAIPMSIFAPAVSAAQDGEINLSTINFPKWGVDKVIQDFEKLTDSEKDVTVESNNGSVANVTTSANGHYVTGEDGNTRLASTAISDSGQPTIRVYYATPEKDNSAWPTADSVMYSVHIDATEVTSSTTVSTRLTIEHGTGSSSRSTYYALRNEIYYFLPDATEENPNPELETRRSTNVNSKDNVSVGITAGVAGTYYFPLSMFTYDDSELEDLPTYTDNSATTIYGDTQSSDNITVKQIYNYFASWRHFSALCFNLRTQLKTNETVYFDNVCWMSENNLPYKTQLITEDFADTTVSDAIGSWTGGITATDFITEDGRFAVTTTNGKKAGAYYAFQAKTIGAWPKNATAFAVDLDVSEIKGHNLRYALRFYENGTNTDASKVFMPANGNIYFVNENGAVSTVAIGEKTSDGGLYGFETDIPQGFKGKLIIPIETMRCVTDKDTFSDALYDMAAPFAEFEIKGYGIEGNISIDDNKTIYFDNFAYYVEPEAPEAGTTFSATVNPSMNVEEYITEAVKTTEVWVKSTSGGAILNKKFHSTGAAYYTYNLSVGVNAAGNPYYNISDGNGGKNYGNGHTASCTFTDVNVNTGNWTHLAFVQKADSIDLYVNSALAGSVAVADFDVIVNGKLTVGHVFGNEVTGKTNYFGGEIANLRLWNDVRTPAELYYNAVEIPADTTGLIAGWNLNGETPFADVSGKGNDIVEYDYEISKDDALYAELDKGAAEGEYSMVFIPDTQIVNKHYNSQLAETYDWILANKEKYNIQAVMGLGDITDKNDDALDANGDGVVTREEAPNGEWASARAQFDRLTAAGIPWTVVPGNHDCKGASVGPRNYANLNQFFPLSEISQFAYFGGSYTDTSVVNSYYYLTVGNVKYLLLCLDQEPKPEAIDWANQVVAAHPDYRVIVTTHIYMTSQGVYYVPKVSDETPHEPHSYTGFDTYESLWNGFLAKHANIDMVLCGHSSTPNIVARTDKGMNGNDVLQICVDTQAIDYTYKSASCVAVATFSADGNNVRWRLYSTAQEMFLDEDSQFTTSLEATTSAAPGLYPSAEEVFNDVTDVEDFYTFSMYPLDGTNKNHTSAIGVGTAVATPQSAGITLENFSIEKRALKISVPETHSANRVSMNFKNIKHPTGDANAVALYLDASQSTVNDKYRITYYPKKGVSRSCVSGTVLYTLADDGTFNKIVATGSEISIGVAFKGWVIIPFDNTFNDGSQTVAMTASDTVQATAGKTGSLTWQWTGTAYTKGADYYMDSICYLNNFAPEFLGTTEDTKPTNNVVLTDEITVNYKLDAADLETKGYTPTRAEFEVNGVVTNVDEFTEENGKYVFAFNGVNPKNIADNITVTYFATKEGDTSGTEYSAYKQNYSVKEYCDSILKNYDKEDAAEVKNVIKGMLNFSAASQEYFDYDKDNLANAGLDAADKELNFTEEEKPQSKLAFTQNANPANNTVTWKSAGLNFSSNVALRFNIEVENIEGLVVKAVVGEETWFIPAEAFEVASGTNRYYVYFNKLSVACMRDTVDFTVYKDGVQVSDTLTYSIESYAAAKFTSGGAIEKLVKSMIKYGDAARILNGNAAQ